MAKGSETFVHMSWSQQIGEDVDIDLQCYAYWRTKVNTNIDDDVMTIECVIDNYDGNELG